MLQEFARKDGLVHGMPSYVVGALVGLSLAWTMAAVLLGMRAQTMYSLVTLLAGATFGAKS